MKGPKMKKKCQRRIPFGPRDSNVHKEIWGDYYKANPDLSALLNFLNSGEKMKTLCPHCGDAALTRSTRQMSKLVKHSICSCLNPACGHTFVISVEAIWTISPPAFPDPEVAVQLKQSKRAMAIYGSADSDADAISRKDSAMT